MKIGKKNQNILKCNLARSIFKMKKIYIKNLLEKVVHFYIYIINTTQLEGKNTIFIVCLVNVGINFLFPSSEYVKRLNAASIVNNNNFLKRKIFFCVFELNQK